MTRRLRRARDRGDDADGVAAPALVAIEFDDGRTLEFTDAGGWVSLGFWVVDDPAEVPAVAKLGPDPADPDFSRADFDRAVVGRRKQIKAVLQEQESLAGIGNAYSDEILHAAKISPVAHAAALSESELDRLFDATVGTIASAIEARRGIPIDQLKAAKVEAMQVHGRAGETCPVCGDTDPRLLVREHDGPVLPDVPDERRGASSSGLTDRVAPDRAVCDRAVSKKHP